MDKQKLVKMLWDKSISVTDHESTNDTVYVIEEKVLLDIIAQETKKAEDELLYDLDEIENKPWRVFRQLAEIMPEYADTYHRYEKFYAYGGGNTVMKLIEKFESELQAQGESK